MTIYAVTLSIMLVASLLSHSRGFSKQKDKYVILAGIILVIVSGFRYQVGSDYYNYMVGYDSYVKGTISWIYQPAVNLVARIASVIYNDYASWFFIMAMITTIPVIIVCLKESDIPDLSMLLFVLLGCWHLSFNIIKQCVAASIILCGYCCLVDRKVWRWIIFCLIGAMFHFSALLMIPVYFLVTRKPTLKLILCTFGLGLVLMLFYDRLFDLASFLKLGRNIVGLNSYTWTGSVNIFRILVSFAPGVLLLIYKNQIDFEDPKISVLVNMTVLNMALNLGAMNSIYIHRICVYTNIFNILLLPVIIKRLDIRNRMVVIPIMIVLYTVFWWHDLSSGSTLSQFQWIFSR